MAADAPDGDAVIGWHDPTHGRIDRDIQEHVDAMDPTDVAQRVAIENTLQTNRKRQRGYWSDPTSDPPGNVINTAEAYRRISDRPARARSMRPGWRQRWREWRCSRIGHRLNYRSTTVNLITGGHWTECSRCHDMIPTPWNL